MSGGALARPEAATEQAGLAAMSGRIGELEQAFEAWNEPERDAVAAYREAVERLNGEALRRLVAALKGEPAAREALKAAAGDELVYAVLRRHNIIKPSLNERIEQALASVRPALAGHGGDVELVRLEPPMAEVRFIGACDGCSASMLTFHAGIKKAIQDACPEIAEVRQAKAREARQGAVVSPFASAEDRWSDAALAGDVPDEGVLAAVVGGERVLLARSGEALVCYDDACAHLGFPLDDGRVEAGVLTCPHHGFRYGLADGVCLTAPGLALRRHLARQVGDRIQVRLAR